MLTRVNAKRVLPVVKLLPAQLRKKIEQVSDPDRKQLIAEPLVDILFEIDHFRTFNCWSEDWKKIVQYVELTDEDVKILEEKFREIGWSEEVTNFTNYESIIPNSWKYIGQLMSNFDYEIKSTAEADLKRGNCYGDYTARDFCGHLWYMNGFFYTEVWVHKKPVKVLRANKLHEIMVMCCEKYGKA